MSHENGTKDTSGAIALLGGEDGRNPAIERRARVHSTRVSAPGKATRRRPADGRRGVEGTSAARYLPAARAGDAARDGGPGLAFFRAARSSNQIVIGPAMNHVEYEPETRPKSIAAAKSKIVPTP